MAMVQTMAWLLPSMAAICIVSQSYADNVILDDGFNMEWSVISGRMHQPKCVDIPTNMTLCHKISYTKMRLPNLLEHDNLQEATQQAANWMSLLGIRCHPDTQVFLCSLFSPVCLERIVYPCRSLCEGVRDGCEGYMQRYGFPWPDMFKCDKFPADDDLCIPAPSSFQQKVDDQRVCKPCHEADTYEGILDNYCTAHYVIRAKLRGLQKQSTLAGPGEIELHLGKGKKKFYKRTSSLPKRIYRQLQSNEAHIFIEQGIGCTCDQRIVKGENHLMAIRAEEKYDVTGQKIVKFYANFITTWKDHNKRGNTKMSIKKALRAIRKNEDVCEGGVNTLNIHQQTEKDMERGQKADKKRPKKDRRQRQ